MKAVQLVGIGKLEIREVPDAKINRDTDVLIRVKTVGVCGSDIHYFTEGKIGSQIVEFPFTLGHEGAGIVEEIGSAVNTVKVGDRIAIEPAMPCGYCDQCLSGRKHTCRNLRFLGCPKQAQGCMSELIVMPQESCIPINNKLTLDDAAISEPLSIGLYATKLAGNLENKNIGILGFGPIGMSVLLSAQAQNCANVFVTDKLDARLKIANNYSNINTSYPNDITILDKVKDSAPLLLDYVFECCGKQEAVHEAIQFLKPGGKLLIIGIPVFDTWKFHVDSLRHKEICIQSVRRQNNCVEEALHLIENKIDIKPMITHRFHFTQAQEAFQLVENYRDGVMKAMIDF